MIIQQTNRNRERRGPTSGYFSPLSAYSSGGRSVYGHFRTLDPELLKVTVLQLGMMHGP